jgi:hypothetical protein
MMGFKYPIGKHVENGMMVQTLQDGILKLNYLLPDELFKQMKTCASWGGKRSHATLKCCWKGRCYCQFMLRLQEGRDIDKP